MTKWAKEKKFSEQLRNENNKNKKLRKQSKMKIQKTEDNNINKK